MYRELSWLLALSDYISLPWTHGSKKKWEKSRENEKSTNRKHIQNGLCHVVLSILQVCEHCNYRNAKEYQWQNKTIILAADYASSGIYNFIIPLRAHFKSKTSLNPIILLLERRPDVAFLDAISYFPLVYWMLGSIDCLDDLLRGGITLAENVVVVNKELSNSAEEDSLADCNTIVAVQNMFK